MGFSRQEDWSGLSFPSPGDLSDPGIEPGSPTLQADALPSGPPVTSRLLIERCDQSAQLTVSTEGAITVAIIGITEPPMGLW